MYLLLYCRWLINVQCSFKLILVIIVMIYGCTCTCTCTCNFFKITFMCILNYMYHGLDF